MKILDLFNFFYNIPIAWYPVLFLLMGGVFFSFFLIRNRFFTTSQKEWIYFSQPTLKKIFTFLMFISLLFCLVIWLNVVRFVPDRLASFVDKDSLLVAGTVNAVDYAIKLDAFGSFSALLFSLILFSSALSVAFDNDSVFTPSIAIFEIFVYSGFLGIFYTNSLFIIGFCLFLIQLGVSGLLRQWAKFDDNVDGVKTNVFLRLLLASLFIIGVMFLKLQYHTTLLSALYMPLADSLETKLAFVFITASLLYLFVKPSGHVSVPSMNVYFKLKSLIAFYAFLKIFFLLFATIEGYERVSLFLLISGLILILFALMLACKEQNPLSMMNSTESFLKGLLLISVGVAQYGIYSGEKAIFLGIPGLQAMLLIWIFFVPLTALFSYMTAYMEQKVNEQQNLWQVPALLKKIPLLILALVFIVFTATGIPPFGGFLFYQLLLRSSLFISPIFTYVLFMLTLLFLLFSMRFILAISFAAAPSVAEISTLPVLEKKLRVPIFIVFLLCCVFIFFTGEIFDTLVSSCVTALTVMF